MRTFAFVGATLLVLSGAATRPAYAATSQYLFCFSYGHEPQDGIRVSQVLPFQAPETRTELLGRLAADAARDGDESGCSVSATEADAKEDRAEFIADGGHARQRWMRNLSVKEVSVDVSDLNAHDRMYLADADAEQKGSAMYTACYVSAGPGKHPVLLAQPFLWTGDATTPVKGAMANIAESESYSSPQCESHADRQTAADFLKQGEELAATYGVRTAALRVQGK